MRKCLIAGLGGVLLLTGCSIPTPMGTVNISLDTSQKLELSQDLGESVDAVIDKLLENTALPNGMTSEDVKEFIKGNAEMFGITEDNINITEEDIDKAVEEITDAIGETVIDESALENAIDGTSDCVESEAETTESAAETETEAALE